MIFSIFLIAFALFGILRASKQYSARAMSRHWFMLWTLFWVFVIFVALVPNVIDQAADVVGVERGADLLVYVAVLLLVYAIFRSMALTQKLHEEQTELVRKIAIANAKVPTASLP